MQPFITSKAINSRSQWLNWKQIQFYKFLTHRTVDPWKYAEILDAGCRVNGSLRVRRIVAGKSVGNHVGHSETETEAAHISHRIVETRNRVWEKSNKAIQLNLIIIKWR